MSEETKQDQAVQEAQAEAPVQAQSKAIMIELDDLSDTGKAKAEKQLGRSIADIPYQIKSQESQPGSLVVMEIQVSQEAYKSEQTLLLKDLNKQVTLPGFRKGKAPIKLLERRLGEDSVRDTVRSIATNVLRQEVAKGELNQIANPQVPAFTLADDAELTFTAELEVEPKVELKEYKGIEVEAEDRPVTDAMVDERIETMRRQNAVLEDAAADHGLAEGDVVTLDIEVTSEEGERLAHLCQQDKVCHNYKYELPQGVSEALEGKSVGQSVQVGVDNKSTNRRGEEVFHRDNYSVTVKGIKVNKLPELDDEFAKDLGQYESLADLRKQTREGLEKSEEERAHNEAVGKLYRELVVRNPIDAPRSLLSRQQFDLIMQDSYQLQRMGLRLEQVVQDTDKYLSDQRTSAEEMVKVSLLTRELAKLENLTVTDEDVDKEIEKLAEQSGRKPLAIRARLEANKQLDQFREELGRRKIGDFLLSCNTVKKVAPKPAEEATEEASEEAAPKKKATKKAAAKKDEAGEE